MTSRVFAALIAALLPAAALAQPHAGPRQPADPANARPAILNDIGYDQRLGETVPGDIRLRDESGREVRFGDFLGRKPVVLSLVYYECPMLCTLTLNGLAGALKTLSFDVGREFDVVTVSFDSRETPALAAAKKKAYVARYGRPGAEQGWHFLTGEKDQIARLTSAVGFRYAWDERTKQFAHPSGVTLLTPDGTIARYLYGIEYAPKDLRMGLMEASERRIGNVVEHAMLYCYKYDPVTGRYGILTMRLIRAGGILTVLGLGGFIFAMRRKELAMLREQAR